MVFGIRFGKVSSRFKLGFSFVFGLAWRPVVPCRGGPPQGGPGSASVFIGFILEFTSSVEFGRVERRAPGLRMAASAFMRQQWAHMRNVSSTLPPSSDFEEDIDHRPSWDPTPPTVKREWMKTIPKMRKKVITLTEARESSHFRASSLPPSLKHVEADLKGKQPFKDATHRTNVAGACGLALVRGGELAYSALGRESELMTRLSDAISGDSPQDAASLLQLIQHTKEDLHDIRRSMCKVANTGTEIAAGYFNQGVDELRRLVWESPLTKSVESTLKQCPPSLSLLFGDDARIKEALEAERRRPYQANSYRSKSFQPRGGGKGKTWPPRKPKSKRGKPRRYQDAGKATGPHPKKGEGQKHQ
jgi:hypothetical protein